MPQLAKKVNENMWFRAASLPLSADHIERLNDTVDALRAGLVPAAYEVELDQMTDAQRHEYELALLDHDDMDDASAVAYFGTGGFVRYTDKIGNGYEAEKPSARLKMLDFDAARWLGFKDKMTAGSSADPVACKDAETPAAAALPSSEPFKVNDALFIGGDLPQKVLDLQMKLGFGRSRDDKRWPGKAIPFSAVLGLLTKHEVGDKDGKAFIQGTAIGNERKAKAMEGMWIAGLDLDSGIFPKPIAEKIQNDLGLTAIIYTTHSHNSTETHVVQNSFSQWAKKNGADDQPTIASMKRYMREAKKWEEWVCNSIELLEEPVHTKDGISYVLTHAAMPKFRVIFPLDKPYIIAQQKLSQQDAINLWKGRLLGLAKILDVPIDESCLDPSRLFYLPRHKQGRDFEIIVTSGDALDFAAVPAIDTRSRTKPDDNVFAQAAKQLAASNGANFMVGNFNLKQWAAKTARSFDAARMIRETCADKIRSDDGQDKLEVLCPWDFEHGNAGDTDDRACWIKSAHADSSDTGFGWGCRHNSCSGRDRLAFVCEALQQGWFSADDLTNEDYRIVTVEDEAAAQTKLPKGFVRKPHGICFARTDSDDKPVFDFVCNSFDVIGESRDEHGHGWSIVIEFDDKGTKRRERIAMSELQGGGKLVRERLTHKGFRILASTTGRNRCDELLSMLTSDKHLLDVTRAGFHDWNGRKVFVSPTGIALDAKGQCTDVSLSDGALLKHTEPRGTLDGWLEAMNHVAASGVQHWVLGAATGFAGPILNLLNRPSTGSALIGDSSQGKSLGQEIGASVWAHGDPNEAVGLFRSARSTDNALEGRAALSHGTLLAIDELALMKPEAVGDTIFMLASGSGKSRMKATTALTDVKAWRCFYTVSAERSIAELVESSGKALLGGHSVRLPTLNVSGTRKLEPDEMARVQSFRDHFGQAWRPFIAHLFAGGHVDDPSRLRERLDACINGLIGPDASAAERRTVETIALLQLAGELAIEAGALPPTMDFAKAAKWGWASFMTGAEAEALSPRARVVAAVRKNLLNGWNNDVVPLDMNAPPSDDAFENGERETEGNRFRTPRFGWYDTTTVYVVKDALVLAADGVGSQRAIAQHLRDAGLLVVCGDKLHWAKLPRRGAGAHYRIKLADLKNGPADGDD